MCKANLSLWECEDSVFWNFEWWQFSKLRYFLVCVCVPLCVNSTWGLEMFKLTREWNVAVVSSAEVPELAELQATPEL